MLGEIPEYSGFSRFVAIRTEVATMMPGDVADSRCPSNVSIGTDTS